MNNTSRPEVPKEQIIQVNNSKKIDFTKPFTFIYFGWWFYVLTFIPYYISFIISVFTAMFVGLRLEGRKNLKILRKQGTIIVSNHCHYFDTVFINISLFYQLVHVAVAQRNFEVPYVRRILRFVRTFPIPKGPKGMNMISPVVGEALKRKRHIHFLPEGELVHLGQQIHKFRTGAFRLSYIHQAPIIPMVYVIKRRKLFGKLMKPNWVKMTLVIGEPILPPKLTGNSNIPIDEINKMTDKVATWMEETIAKHHQGETV